MGHREARLQGDCPVEVLQRGFRPLERDTGDAAVVEGHGVVRLEVDRPVIGIDRGLLLAEGRKRIAAIAVGFGVRRLEDDGAVVALDRGLEPVEIEQRVGAIEVGFGQIRIEGKGAVEALDRGHWLIERPQRIAEIVVRRRQSGIYLYCLADQLGRASGIFRSVGDQPRQMQRFMVSRLRPEDFLHDRLRLDDLPLSIQRPGLFQRVPEAFGVFRSCAAPSSEGWRNFHAGAR
ncbi:MAG: hypothetical protein K2X72_32585 [Reyranella sp.]|nr:hypothetical protein [Reyranella sp.]